MKEIEDLFLAVKSDVKFVYLSYCEVFEQYYGFNPHTMSLKELIAQVHKYVGEIQGLENPTIADCLDILF